MDGRKLDDVTLETKYDRRRYPWDDMLPGDTFDVIRYEHDASIASLKNTVASAASAASRKTGHRYVVTIASAGRVSVHCVRPEPAKAVEDDWDMQYFVPDQSNLFSRKRYAVPYRNEVERSVIGGKLMAEMRQIDSDAPAFAVPHVTEDASEGRFIISVMHSVHSMRGGFSDNEFMQASIQREARRLWPTATISEMIELANQVSYEFNLNEADGRKPPEKMTIVGDIDGGLMVRDDTNYVDQTEASFEPSAEPF